MVRAQHGPEFRSGSTPYSLLRGWDHCVTPEPASPCEMRVPIAAPLPAREPCKPGSLRPPGEKVCGSLRQRIPEVTGPSPPRDVHASSGEFPEGWPTLRVWGPTGGAVEGDEAGTAVLVKEEATPCHWENLTPVHPRSHCVPASKDGALPPAGAEGWPWRGAPSSRCCCLPDGGEGPCGPVDAPRPLSLLSGCSLTPRVPAWPDPAGERTEGQSGSRSEQLMRWRPQRIHEGRIATFRPTVSQSQAWRVTCWGDRRLFGQEDLSGEVTSKLRSE